MRRLFATFFGMILGGLFVALAFNFHVVRTPDDWVFAKKQQASLTDVYVDIREWNPSTWKDHPELANALFQKGRGDLVKQSLRPEGIFHDLLRLRKHEGAARPDGQLRRE